MELTGEPRKSSAFPVLTLRPTTRGKIIGNDPKIRHVLGTIDRVARSACTVLITGETGTGKELVVAALHDASPRSAKPLVTINCGAIASELVESELFGHTRGAFTGASSTRRGLVAAAEGGTLFLDEVGELSPSVQVKLLRLLQQREYIPVGESHPVRCDVRIVAATHRDLEAEVARGRFREDLFYRLNVIHVRIPALRERGADVRLLAQHFFRHAVQRAGRTDLLGLSSALLSAIEANPWPGNVRALENAVERGVLLAAGPWVEPRDAFASSRPRSTMSFEAVSIPLARCSDRPLPLQAEQALASELRVPALPAPPSTMLRSDAPQRRASDPNFPRVLPPSGVELFSASENYQNNLIRQALLRTGGNKNQAAKLLGMNRTTLVEIIRRRKLG